MLSPHDLFEPAIFTSGVEFLSAEDPHQHEAVGGGEYAEGQEQFDSEDNDEHGQEWFGLRLFLYIRMQELRRRVNISSSLHSYRDQVHNPSTTCRPMDLRCMNRRIHRVSSTKDMHQ